MSPTSLSTSPPHTGERTTYAEKIPPDEGEAARNDPNGFYHGMTIKPGRDTLVMCGPPVLFVPADVPARPEPTFAAPDPAQLSLF